MTRIERIAELQRELNDCIAPHLTQESIECVDDAYQEALEIGWFKDDLRDQIKYLESLSDEQFINDFPELLDKDLSFDHLPIDSLNDKGDLITTYPDGSTLRYVSEEVGWVDEDEEYY